MVIDKRFHYTTKDGHCVSYTISRRNNFIADTCGADTIEGATAGLAEVFDALAAYRKTPDGRVGH